jgi:AcrR family transcriptional regulator
MARPYDRTRRAEAAARTADRILDATGARMLAQPAGSITLQQVADDAGVTVQTVLRHMGSRDGLIERFAARTRARILARRTPATRGDPDAALAALLDHYEQDGPLVLALLSQESVDELARAGVAEGRATHRAWVLEHLLADRPAPSTAVVDAAVAATDLSVWKLLRLDLGRSREETATVVRRLLHAALEAP